MKRLLFLLLASTLLTGSYAYGETLYIGGGTYIGEVVAGRPHGQGTWTHPDGESYVGELKAGRRHGQGTYIWANGEKYAGEWKDDQRYGQGTYTYASGAWKGDKYVGEFKNGKRHGQGTYTKSDGHKYVGEYKNGKRWKGIRYLASGEVAGTYSNGKWCGGCKPTARQLAIVRQIKSSQIAGTSSYSSTASSTSSNMGWCVTSTRYNNKYVHYVTKTGCAGMDGKVYGSKYLAQAERQRQTSGATTTAASSGAVTGSTASSNVKKLKETKSCPRCDLADAQLRAMDLTGANLTGANLTGATLSGVNLAGASLTGANLSGANLREVNLRDVDLTGANLTGANLTGAKLTGANLTGAKLPGVNLTEVDLTGVVLTGVDLAGADLTKVDLPGVALSEANLREANLTGANLSRAKLFKAILAGANLTGADLTGVDLAGANLREVNLAGVDLTEVNLTEANLTGANLAGAKLFKTILSGASLTGIDLSRVDLTWVDLTGVDLTGVDLTGVDLAGINLREVNLTGANLAEVDLTGVNLAGVDLTGADLTGAKLYKTILSGANLTGVNLAGAEICRTTMPDGSTNNSGCKEAATAPGSPPTATLTLRSNVKDDRVYIDGNFKGSTQLVLDLPKGQHTIRIEKDGYKAYEETIDLDQAITFKATLQKTTSQTDSADIVFWQAITGSSDPAMYRAYLKQFPAGVYAVLAKLKIKELGGDSSVTRSSIPNLAYGDYYALVIGNNEYQQLSPLRTAVNDARAVSTLLEVEYGFNVKLLENASRRDILRSLSGLREQVSHEDNILIYYAGHGYLDEAANEGFWLPVDAEDSDQGNWLATNRVVGQIKAMQAKHVMVVADSCFSGTLTRAIKIDQRTPEWLREIVKKKARTALTSGGLEPVMDSGGGNHSAFAHAFISLLEDNDGVLDAAQLFSELRPKVMVNSTQTPQYGKIHLAGDDGGDFLFVRH